VAGFRPDGEGFLEEGGRMRIELPVDAHLPTDYIESERLRLEIYKRIAEVRGEDDIAALMAELVDRYGPVPVPAVALFEVARCRLLCRAVGLKEVVASGRFVRLFPVGGEKGADLPDSRQARLARLYPGSVVKLPTHQVLVPGPPAGVDALVWATDLVRAVFC